MRRFLHTSVLIGVLVLNGPTVKTYQYSPGRYKEIRPELTLENLYDQLVWEGIQHPDVVMKQAILETMWLKCKHCSLMYNNLFGFRTDAAYLKFDHWTDCVKFYKQWQDKYYNGGDYMVFLYKIRFATSPNYIRHLNGIDDGLFQAVLDKTISYWP